MSKTVKLTYLTRISTSHEEIWHDDAYWPSLIPEQLKVLISKNSRWQMFSILLIVKATYFGNGLASHREITTILHMTHMNHIGCSNFKFLIN